MHPVTILWQDEAWYVITATSLAYLITRNGETRWVLIEDVP